MARKRIKFAFQAPANVKEVRLCGDFSGWEDGAIIMKNSKSGEFSKIILLEPGEYQYKFWADGMWYNDPQADKQVGNSLGTQNSVKIVH